MIKQKIQAIFFDFDGVIVDSTRTKTEAFCTLFRSFDEDTVKSIVDYHKQHGGISRVDKIAYAHRTIIGKPLSGEELAHWAASYSELVLEKVVAVDWIAGAIEFLDAVQNRVLLFVISGTPEDELNHILKRRKIAAYFQEILGSPTRKPAHIRNLLSKFQLDPGQCIFVGDALTDYNAALETGLHFIGIQGEVPFPAGTTVLPDCRGLQKAVSSLLAW